MLTLHAHPLSSFCMKVEMALYETSTPFQIKLLDLGDAGERQRFAALWPVGKMPVLVDPARGETVPETSIIVEYLQAFYPAEPRLIPLDAEAAWRVRFWDRFFDLHVQAPMQRYSDFRREQPGARDAAIPEIVVRQLATAYDVLEAHMTGRAWCVGDEVSLADCAAAPALYYADRIKPLRGEHPVSAAYLERLLARPSFARALEEARPYLSWVPF